MNLLQNLNNITDAPCDNTKIVIVWYDELMDTPHYDIKVCKWNKKTNRYQYVSDDDFIFDVPEKYIVGWCYL